MEIAAPLTLEDRLAAQGGSSLRLPIAYRPAPVWDPWTAGEPITTYDYFDKDSNLCFQCHRWHARGGPSHGDKAFFWRHWDNITGVWTWGLREVTLLPYHLPDVINAIRLRQKVYIVEGEKDVETLAARGLVATTNPLGAMQWSDDFNVWFEGADVVIVPDNDPIGHLHAARVAVSLRRVAASVAVVPLPDVFAHGDISAWLDADHTVSELVDLACASTVNLSDEQLIELLSLTPESPLQDDDPSAVLKGLAAIASAWSRSSEAPFERTRSRFARLGRAIVRAKSSAGSYARIVTVIRQERGPLQPLLADAFLVERRSYELSTLSFLATSGIEEVTLTDQQDWQGHEHTIVRAPNVRLVHTTFDWDAWDASDPFNNRPLLLRVSYVLRVEMQASVSTIRLHQLPALVLEMCAQACSSETLTVAICDSVSESASRIEVRARAQEQVTQLLAANLLRIVPEDAVTQLVACVRNFLVSETSISRPQALRALLGRAVTMMGERSDAIPHDLFIGAVLLDIIEQALEGTHHPFHQCMTRARGHDENEAREGTDELCSALEWILAPTYGTLPPLLL